MHYNYTYLISMIFHYTYLCTFIFNSRKCTYEGQGSGGSRPQMPGEGKGREGDEFAGLACVATPNRPTWQHN